MMVNARVIQKNKGVLLPELVSVMVCMLLKVAGTQSCRTTFFCLTFLGIRWDVGIFGAKLRRLSGLSLSRCLKYMIMVNGVSDD